MRRFAFLLTVLAAASGSPLHPQSLVNESLRRILCYTLEHNADLAGMALDAAAVEKARPRAAALPMPMIGWERMVTPAIDAVPAMVEDRFMLSQDIPFPGTLTAKSRLAETASRTARERSRWNGETMKIEAARMYVRIAYMETALAIMRRKQLQFSGMRAMVESRIAFNTAGQTELLSARMMASGMEVEIAAMQADRDRMLQDLLTMMNADHLPEGTVFTQLQPPVIRETDRELTARALAENGEVRRAALAVEESERRVDIASMDYFPTVSLSGSLTFNESGLSQYSVGVNVGIPMYFFADQRPMVSSMQTMREAARSAERQVIRKYTTEVAARRARLAAFDKALIDLRNTVLQDASRLLELSLNRYRAGEIMYERLVDNFLIQFQALEREALLESARADEAIQLAYITGELK
jgi:outer membrane protein TolC